MVFNIRTLLILKYTPVLRMTQILISSPFVNTLYHFGNSFQCDISDETSSLT